MRAFAQASYWKNSETLWGHTLAVTRDNDVAHNNLGFLFMRRGELDKAISEFEAALSIRSRSTQTHYSLGAALIQNNLGNAFARKQLWDEAIDHLQEAVKLRPDYADAYFNLGSVLFHQGQIDEAVAQWQKVLAIRPTDAEAHRDIGNALRKQGNVKGAIAEYQETLNITPEDSVALNNLAWILATSSDALNARRHTSSGVSGESGAGLRRHRSKFCSYACRCACRGRTIRRSRRDSRDSKDISQRAEKPGARKQTGRRK